MDQFATSAHLDNQALTEQAYWVARCRRGDDVAFMTLIEKHRRRLIRVAANVLRDPHEAEDVAQESFVKAFREINRLRDDRAFSSYIYKICVRLCMDRLRSKRTEPGITEQSQKSEGSGIETRVLVEKLLNKLSADLRMTLVLREMEQLSYEEVADVLRVPVGTVRSRLHTAREKFRMLYEEEMREMR